MCVTNNLLGNGWDKPKRVILSKNKILWKYAFPKNIFLHFKLSESYSKEAVNRQLQRQLQGRQSAIQNLITEVTDNLLASPTPN